MATGPIMYRSLYWPVPTVYFQHALTLLFHSEPPAYIYVLGCQMGKSSVAGLKFDLIKNEILMLVDFPLTT